MLTPIIRYRTCSWQKVSLHSSYPSLVQLLEWHESSRGYPTITSRWVLENERCLGKFYEKYELTSSYQTAALLFSEYICLAIMSFPYSYSVLGLVPGIILTAVVAALVLYTSLVLWEFCLRHPEVRDVCDIGQMLFWGKEWAWYCTAVMFILNNTFIQVCLH